MPAARTLQCFSLQPLAQSSTCSGLFYRGFNTGRRLIGHHLLGQFQYTEHYIVISALDYHPHALQIHLLNTALRQLDRVELPLAPVEAGARVDVRCIAGEVRVTVDAKAWRLHVLPSPIRRLLNQGSGDAGERPLRLLGKQWLRIATASNAAAGIRTCF